MSKRLTIRNSTAEFLIFQAQSQANGVEVFYQDEMLWLTQKAMSTLFDVDRTVITKHLKNIFESEELQLDSVCAKFAHTAEDGKTYSTQRAHGADYMGKCTRRENSEDGCRDCKKLSERR